MMKCFFYPVTCIKSHHLVHSSHLKLPKYDQDPHQMICPICTHISFILETWYASKHEVVLPGHECSGPKWKSAYNEIKWAYNTFWLWIKILKYVKEGIIAKSSSTTYHGNVSLLQQHLSSQTLHHRAMICNIPSFWKQVVIISWHISSILAT